MGQTFVSPFFWGADLAHPPWVDREVQATSLTFRLLKRFVFAWKDNGLGTSRIQKLD